MALEAFGDEMIDFMKAVWTKNSSEYEAEAEFTYDFPSSGFPRVDRVRFLIEDQPEWDYSVGQKDLVENIGRAASRFGFGPSLSEEESSLCLMLARLNAGPLIMTYAWGLYADMLVQEMAA